MNHHHQPETHRVESQLQAAITLPETDFRQRLAAAYFLFFLFSPRLESSPPVNHHNKSKTDANNETPIAIQQQLAGESAMSGDLADRVGYTCYSLAPVA